MSKNKVLYFLLLFTLSFSQLHFGLTEVVEHTGEILLIVQPNMSMKLEMDLEGDAEAEQAPFTSISSSMSLTPVSSDLTDFKLDITVNIPFEYGILLSSLNLDIDLHQTGLDSNGTLSVGMLGMANLDGYFTFDTNELTTQSTLTIEGNITIWHTLIESEFIQGLIDTLPEYRDELSEQIYTESQGNLTLIELNILEYLNMSDSSKLWMKVIIEGDWVKASLAYASTSMNDLAPPSSINLAPLSPQTSDMKIRFDKNNLAFKIEGSGRYQGDLNAQVNNLKNQQLEETLKDVSDTTASIIEDLLLPMELDVTSLSMSLDITSSSNQATYRATIDNFQFTPPNPKSLLVALQEASEDMSEEGYLLIIEGGSEDGKEVEIIVPEETTTPQTIETHMAEWKFHNLVNLDKITFKVNEIQDSGDTSDTSLLNSEYIMPAVAIIGLALGLLLISRLRR